MAASKAQVMAQPNAVEVIEVCKVCPSPTATPEAAPKSLPLTFFDIRWLRLLPSTERLFFYEISARNSSSFFFSSVLPRLKHSLSLTLLHFLPAAGNLTWPPTSTKPSVEYVEGDGVSLTVAMSNADFCRLSGTDVFCEATEYRPLVPELPASHEQVAVLAIQVTVFPNYGVSIGITNHHAVLDGQSLILFVKSWAYICRSLGPEDSGDDFLQLPPVLIPVYDREYVKDPADLGTIFSDRWRNIDGPDNRSLGPVEVKVEPDSVRGTFRLPRGKLEKLKQLASKEIEQRGKKYCHIHVSTYLLTFGYTWICLAKAEELSDDKIHFAVAMDFRPRLEPPLPATYFGNCIGGDINVVEREALLGKGGLFVAMSAISEAIKGLEKGLLDRVENWVPSSMDVVETLPRLYSVASSHRFEVYGTDFGWGVPRKVDVISIDKTAAMSLSDNPNGDGGVEIGLVLRKHHMEAFASFFAEGLDHLISQ